MSSGRYPKRSAFLILLLATLFQMSLTLDVWIFPKDVSKIIITAQDSISTDIKHKILVTETPPELRIKNRKLIHLHKPTAIH